MRSEDGPCEPETLSSETVYETADFAVIEDTLGTATGEPYTIEYISEQPAVVVYPYTTDGDVVVIDEWRQPVGRTSRGLPVGSLQEGEAIEAGARRELREETGYEAADVEHVRTVEPANGLSDTSHHHVVAYGCTPTATKALDDDERITATTVPETALREALASDELRDGRTALAVAARAFRNS